MTGPQSGFTLAEVLTGMAVLVIGLATVAAAFQYALSGIEAARGQTTAAFLAERKLEQLKAIALVDWTSAILAPSTITEFCVPASDTCTMAPQPGAYRRATTIGEVTAGLCAIPCKLVHVTVFYQPLSSTGQFDQERRVDIVTLLAARA